MTGNIICVCKTCNVAFINPQLFSFKRIERRDYSARIGKPMYCTNTDCSRVDIACTGCGKLFKTHIYKSGRISRRNTCSECAGLNRSSCQEVVGSRKKCSRCGMWKRLDKFTKRKTNRSGLSGHCIKCGAIEWDKYYKNNREQVLRAARENRPKHKERLAAYIESRKEERNRGERERAITDIQFKLNKTIRCLMNSSLKGNGSKGGRKWEDLIGYTVVDLKNHLEKQFTSGMTWANHGSWHIDHIIPITAFNFTSPEQDDFKRCWALKNLQPLWAADNIRKYNKLDKPFQPSLAI